jgi:branched-chain amino acid transport system ATP-binding protein
VLVPEGRQLFSEMTVYENLEMGASNSPRPVPASNKIWSASMNSSHVSKNARHKKAGTLSGGEQQMLAVARGIMAEPRLLYD